MWECGSVLQWDWCNVGLAWERGLHPTVGLVHGGDCLYAPSSSDASPFTSERLTSAQLKYRAACGPIWVSIVSVLLLICVFYLCFYPCAALGALQTKASQHPNGRLQLSTAQTNCFFYKLFFSAAFVAANVLSALQTRPLPATAGVSAVWNAQPRLFSVRSTKIRI